MRVPFLLEPEESPVGGAIWETFVFEEITEEAKACGVICLVGGGANKGEDEAFAGAIGMTIGTVKEADSRINRKPF